MARSTSYKGLIVWKKAMVLARRTYEISQELPKSEAYGLFTQMRRAADSVPSNIAGGMDASLIRSFVISSGTHEVLCTKCRPNLNWRETCTLDFERVGELMNLGSEVARPINGLISIPGEQTIHPIGPLVSSASSANSALKARL